MNYIHVSGGAKYFAANYEFYGYISANQDDVIKKLRYIISDFVILNSE